MNVRDLKILGAAEHNLQNINVTIPRQSLTVITGLSGSGKSSLAFDTIYAEGQRRYVESLSAYARQFLDQMPKPHVEHIEGLSPAISIEQKTVSQNPRSTVGTVTEIYDYLRLIYAHLGVPHCPKCDRPLEAACAEEIVDRILELPQGTRLLVMAPLVRGRKGEHTALFQAALRDGFERAKIDGEQVILTPDLKLEKNLKHDVSIVIDRVVVSRADKTRLTDSVEAALKRAEGLAVVETLPASDGSFPDGIAWKGERVFSEKLACPEHGPQIVELSPRMFSFNSPFGACPACNGLGVITDVDQSRLLGDPGLSLEEGVIRPWANFFASTKGNAESFGSFAAVQARAVIRHFKIKTNVPWRKLTVKERETLLNGPAKPEKIRVKYESSKGSTFAHDLVWEGLLPKIRKRLKEMQSTAEDAESSALAEYLHEVPCEGCAGKRLKPESLAVTFRERNIADLCAMSIGEARRFFDGLKLSARENTIGLQPLKQVTDRLRFLEEVGLHYIALDRRAGTLSGGEGQRIRLATQIGSQLTGVLYVLDEPSIGLHQRDNEALVRTLLRLRDLGNTVIVVEHDEQTIRTADHLIDLGPGAGRLGGRVVAEGTPEEVAACRDSLTGAYLRGDLRIEPPKQRRPRTDAAIRLRGCSLNNLKHVDAEFPLGLMIGVTGVSGSGKSSLVVDTLLPLLMNHAYGSNQAVGPYATVSGLEPIDKAIAVDQSPIGRTPRSNPVTYTKAMDLIRDLFATTPEAKTRGYGPGRFSFNVKGGRCEPCGGDGMIKVEMHFLPDVYVECETCKGRRFNRETLEVTYRGKSIADVLDMTIEEACDFFAAVPLISSKLVTLRDVGLGYIHLGQSATTLSGGEAQRIKLSRELSKRNTGNTVYVLDEPTTGLHFEDIRKLIDVLNRLVDAGSTVIVIEHNLDVIKCCDWLIDLGPEGGSGGGRIIAQGTPEQVAAVEASHTGRFLKPLLATGRQAAIPNARRTRKS